MLYPIAGGGKRQNRDSAQRNVSGRSVGSVRHQHRRRRLHLPLGTYKRFYPARFTIPFFFPTASVFFLCPMQGHRITTTWAEGHRKCAVTDGDVFPTTEYKFKALPESTNHRCRTWCRGIRAHSVDCTFKGGLDSPSFTYQAAFIFFDRHLPKGKRSNCKDFLTKETCKATSCKWKAKKGICRK